MLSIHQRPDSTTIHCGAGFSCHSPIQPTGCTVNTGVADTVSCLLFHCGSAGPTPFSRNSGRAHSVWWLTPSLSVQRCQYLTTGRGPDFSVGSMPPASWS